MTLGRMSTDRARSELRRFTRYDEPGELKQWPAMALASIVEPGEGYVLGIDCADRWLFTDWGTKLVLTNERVVAFTPDPASPMKRAYGLADIEEIRYDSGILAAEMRLSGADFFESYTVPKRLGREFFEAVRARSSRNGT